MDQSDPMDPLTEPESATPMAEALISSIEQGLLRTRTEANEDPAWLARYGDEAWETALWVIGYTGLQTDEPRPVSPR